MNTLSADMDWLTDKCEVPKDCAGAAKGKGRTSMVTGSHVAFTSAFKS